MPTAYDDNLVPDTVNAPFNFQRRQAAIEARKQRLAQLMKQQRGYQAPEGKTVSGHYVAPAWSEQLAAGLQPLAQQYATGQEQKGLEQDTAEFEAADRKAAIEHAMQAPGVVASGEDREGNPIVPPATPEAKIQWAERGMNIPSRKELLQKLVLDQTLQEPVRAEARGEKRLDREDKQTEARATLASQQTLAREKLEQQAEDARRRSEDTRYGVDERRAASSERNAILLQLGQLNAANAAAKQGKLSDKARSDLDAFEASNLGLANAITSLKGASDKGTGWLAGVIQNKVPGGQSLVSKYRDQATNDAIQQTTYWTDEIRHGRFGTALTAPEKASATQYLPGEHDDLDQITKKAEGLQKLLLLNHRRLQLQAGVTPTGTPKTASSGPVTEAAPPGGLPPGWKLK
jgi:hypothetical protein